MSQHAMPRPNPVIKVLLLVTFVRPRVEVTDGTLEVSLGWSFRVSIPRSSVVDAGPAPSPRFSIGAHGWRGRWLVNTATRPLVQVRLDSAAAGRSLGFPIRVRELTLSIADPAAFLTDLRSPDQPV